MVHPQEALKQNATFLCPVAQSHACGSLILLISLQARVRGSAAARVIGERRLTAPTRINVQNGSGELLHTAVAVMHVCPAGALVFGAHQRLRKRKKHEKWRWSKEATHLAVLSTKRLGLCQVDPHVGVLKDDAQQVAGKLAPQLLLHKSFQPPRQLHAREVMLFAESEQTRRLWRGNPKNNVASTQEFGNKTSGSNVASA